MPGCLARGLTKYPQETVAQAKVLYEQGIKPDKIAFQLGISNGVVVRRWFDEAYRQKYNERAKMRWRGEA